MAALRSLLAIYGALDDAIIRSDDTRVAATVDAFLPMASVNTGWYREIETFFFGADAQPTPDLGAALRDILNGNALTTPQKSRLFFAVSAITRVRQVVPTAFPSLPPPAEESEDQSDDGSAVQNDEGFDNWLKFALAAVGPEDISDEERLAQAVTLKDEVAFRFPNRQSFYDFRAYAALQGWIVPETQSIPLCDASIVTVDGIESVVVDTEASSNDVSLTQLKAVVNPYNWHVNYPDFFCDMIACTRPDRDDGWRRVLEKVGFCKYGGLNLRTMLKYIPTAENLYEARLDYDLDEPRAPEGDGLVTVDRGFINMWSTNRNPNVPGVHVRTRKVVHINGFLPYAQAKLVCITGYATASNEFLIGAASSAVKGRKGFNFYGTSVQPTKAGRAPNVTATGPGSGPPPADHVGTTAVKLWTETVRDLTTNYFDLAGKWVTGNVRVEDVADYSKQVTSRLVKAPMDFVDAVSKPRYPGGNGQGGEYTDDPSGTLQQQEDVARALLYQLNVIADEAAAGDKAGKWGLDGWIRTIHNLVDLQVRTYAAILRTSLAGGWWKKLFLGEPWPSEPIPVDPQPFARDLRADIFSRLALPKRTIPPFLIGFRPEYLPPGATQFRMYVKDYGYVGSNYTGDVYLTSRATTPPVTEKITVTVGL
jgi:hypothetical protein